MTEGILTVGELCQHIKLVLDNDELLRTCAVRGEISNVSLYPSGHLYLTLKDTGGQIACVMFRAEEQGLRFKPQDGMRVLAFGRVSIFTGRSQYQLILQDLRPDGMGELYVAFEQLKEKLEKEGLFDPARKRPIPFFPRLVGIVTSLQGAALHDMVTILQKRNPAVRIVVSPSLVQGAEAPESLIQALRRLQSVPSLDVIIVSRGGGSLEELWAFNDENLAREIARCPVPVISAVGHETDFTIADFVADRRASTPSNAAEIVAPDREGLFRHLNQLRERLRVSLIRKVEQDEKFLDSMLRRPVMRLPFERVERESQGLDFLMQKMERLFLERIRFSEMKVGHLVDRLEALSPTGVLKRGYALVRKGKKIVKSAGEAAAAKTGEVLFHDGSVAATFGKKREAIHVQDSFLD